MIRSMTGYGASGAEGRGLRAAVSVRSLNHRFLELSLRGLAALQPLEPEHQGARPVAGAARAGGPVGAGQLSGGASAPPWWRAGRWWRASCPPCASSRPSTAWRERSRCPTWRASRGRSRPVETAPALDDERRERILDLVRGGPRRPRGHAPGRRAGASSPTSSGLSTPSWSAAARIEALSAASRETRQKQLLRAPARPRRRSWVWTRRGSTRRSCARSSGTT